MFLIDRTHFAPTELINLIGHFVYKYFVPTGLNHRHFY